MIRLYLCLLCLLSSLCVANEELPIVIVVPSYNNAQWYEKNLRSILQQNYGNYRVLYINDCSSDATGLLVENMVKEYTDDYQVLSFDLPSPNDIVTDTQKFCDLVNQKRCFFTLVNNQQGARAPLPNTYRSIYSCDDQEIIAIVDGDDWLQHDLVLQEVNTFYTSGNVWMTHGRFIEYPTNQSNWNLKIPNEIIQQNAFRQFRLPSHLRTFYSWLFKKIKLEDLLYKGKFFPMTGDMAMMFPMIEMAGERHVFNNKINYVYNIATQFSENKINPKLQNDMDAYIRKLQPYQRLENAPEHLLK